MEIRQSNFAGEISCSTTHVFSEAGWERGRDLLAENELRCKEMITVVPPSVIRGWMGKGGSDIVGEILNLKLPPGVLWGHVGKFLNWQPPSLNELN